MLQQLVTGAANADQPDSYQRDIAKGLSEVSEDLRTILDSVAQPNPPPP